MKIKSITIEGMHSVLEKKYTFGNLNYLYGRNGAGKSTALQAVQLALLGYIPGVNKKNEAIYRHARNKTLSVTCVIDNEGEDITITRTWTGTGKTVTKAVDISPEGFKIEDILQELELPIYNFSSFMGMTANDMKKWFIDFLPNASSVIDWKAKLTEDLGDMKVIDDKLLDKTLSDIAKIKGEGADLVRNVNQYFKDEQSFQKGNLQRTQSTLESLILYNDCDRDDVEEISKEIEQLQSDLAEAGKIENIRLTNARVNQMIDEIITNADSLEEDDEYKQLYDIIQNKLNQASDLSIKVADARKQLAECEANMKAKQSVISSGGICPYTKSACDSIQTMIAEMTQEVEGLSEKKLLLSGEIDRLVNEGRNLNLEVEEHTKRQKEIAKNYSRRAELRAQLQPEPLIDGDEASVSEISNKIRELQITLSKANANRAYNDMADSLTSEKFKIENTIEVLKVWAKLTDANNMQTDIMKQPFEEMASDMDEYLHKMFNRNDIASKFHLSEKANSFSFGIVRDDKYISFDLLSSGEKCMYTLALMMCIIKRSKSPLKVIMVDDLFDHLDDYNAPSLFESLKSIEDIQLILAGVKKYDIEDTEGIVIEVK